MKKIERYVFGSFLSSFFLAFLMLSFVLTIVPLNQIMTFILQGISTELVGRYALVCIPETMQWTVPLALLVSSILVFSRLSADSEIAAMRACGVNLLTVMRWPLVFAFLCTLLCLFVNNEVVPRGHEVRRQLARRLSEGASLEMLEPGRVITDFKKVLLHFRARDKTDGAGDKTDGAGEAVVLLDVEIDDSRNPKNILAIEAKRVTAKKEGSDIVLNASDIVLDARDITKNGSGRRQSLQASKFNNWRVDTGRKAGEYKRKEKDFRFFEILREIDARKQAVKEAPKTRTELEEKPVDATRTNATVLASFFNSGSDHKAKKKKDKNYSPRQAARRALSDIRTEFMKRWVFAFASICFVLVGVPLGIRAQRKESSVGMGIALVTALAYYLVVILMTNLSKNYHAHPEILIWLPVGLCVLISAWLIPKNL